MSTHRLRCAVLGALLLATGTAAQPSATAESVAVRPAAGASTALGGANTVFGRGAFDALDQPALAAQGASIRLDVSWQIDRFVESGVDPWAVGMIVPLGVDDRRLPALSVSHRRLQADGLAVAGDERLLVDLDHELTNLGMAWRADDGRWSVGVTLHAVSKSGVSGFTLRTATQSTRPSPRRDTTICSSRAVSADRHEQCPNALHRGRCRCGAGRLCGASERTSTSGPRRSRSAPEPPAS